MSPAINKTWYSRRAAGVYRTQHDRMTMCLRLRCSASEIGAAWSLSAREWQLPMLVVVVHDYWLQQRLWLIEHTCRIFSPARRGVGILTRSRESLLAINKHSEFVARQRIANVCEHPIECWIHSDSLANKILREWMNEWLNERTNVARFFLLFVKNTSRAMDHFAGRATMQILLNLQVNSIVTFAPNRGIF